MSKSNGEEGVRDEGVSVASSHRSGFVAVVGRPNVGKSTLINGILAQKIASVTPRPQTTRRRQLGILTLPEAQIIFYDTPGWHAPKTLLGKTMIRTIETSINEADLILFMVDLSDPPSEEDRVLTQKVVQGKRPSQILMVMNKMDVVAETVCRERLSTYRTLLPESDYRLISAKASLGLDDLIREIISRLPEGPAFFPDEDITDLSEREIASDLIREAMLQKLRAEVPHGIAVRIDEYKERSGQGAYIEATVFVERESHKAIVIGKGGAMLKAIGIEARLKIEEMSGRKVFLQLKVKVSAGWRDREDVLRRLGYIPPKG
jgi:GTP-binding protein Era